MKRIFITALLIVAANTASALQLSIKHNKDLPTPYELITKGKILEKTQIDRKVVASTMAYFIAWDKTDDIYWCVVLGTLNEAMDGYATCRLLVQETEGTVK